MKIWREAFSGRKHKNLLWRLIPHSVLLLFPSGQSSVMSSITHVGMDSAVLGEKGSKGKAWLPSWRGFGAQGDIPVLAMPPGTLSDSTPCV